MPAISLSRLQDESLLHKFPKIYPPSAPNLYLIGYTERDYMKRMALSLLLVILVLPAAVAAVGNISVISSPAGATIYLDNTNQGTTPATIESVANGTHTVVLTKTEYVNYTFSSISVSDNQSTPLSATLTAATSALTISSPLSPAYGYNSTTVSNIVITGTGFSTAGPSVILAKSGETNILGTCSLSGSTQLTCSFPITSKSVGSWNVIVTNPNGQSATLTNGFEIRAPTNGVISFGSSPSGASIYINATKKGTTPLSLYDLTPGSYFIRLQRPDYSDYTAQVTVTPGNTTSFFAYLSPVATVTTTPTPTYTPLFTTTATTKITKKSTTKVPTPWPSATTASPVDPLVIIGAIGLGIVILRKD